MIKTDEKMEILADFWVGRMTEQELVDEVKTTLKEDYEDDFVFEDDWDNMEELMNGGTHNG